MAKSLPIGLGDEQPLTQVLLNLVGNVTKLTDAGEVRARPGAATLDLARTVAPDETVVRIDLSAAILAFTKRAAKGRERFVQADAQVFRPRSMPPSRGLV